MVRRSTTARPDIHSRLIGWGAIDETVVTTAPGSVTWGMTSPVGA